MKIETNKERQRWTANRRLTPGKTTALVVIAWALGALAAVVGLELVGPVALATADGPEPVRVARVYTITGEVLAVEAAGLEVQAGAWASKGHIYLTADGKRLAVFTNAGVIGVIVRDKATQ